MAGPSDQRATTAHVNMMTDTIIANLPANGLRLVMRSLLASHPTTTATFEKATRNYIERTVLSQLGSGHEVAADLHSLQEAQRSVRCMLGCGLCFRSLPLIGTLARQSARVEPKPDNSDALELWCFFASLDGDIVQAVTAIEKALFVSTGVRRLSDDEGILVRGLFQALKDCQGLFRGSRHDYPYGRGLLATSSLLNSTDSIITIPPKTLEYKMTSQASPPPRAAETFRLKDQDLPRIFTGLWQLSSPAWGSAPISSIMDQLERHVQGGLAAFDMADHYGDAEIVFGRFLSSYPHREAIFAATKYCVFHPMTATRDIVRANISERCRRLQQDRIDLLQFHWQFYQDPKYLDVLRYLSEDERVGVLGLCNFDTEHLLRVLDQGIAVHTNQVQFSLIDSRPVVKMAEVCKLHNVKLLTYGTLCGGFLADKWIDQAEPDLYDGSITPSQRKYYSMISSWGGWSLFQELLRTLHSIATKHSVSVSNVATRWVLDFPYVGAVIVGARMGISEHSHENTATFGWSLDQNDRAAIELVLAQSRRMEMFEFMGDCGGEYR